MRCNSPLILFCHHVLWESPGTNTLQKALEDTYVNIHMCAQYVCIIEVYIHIYIYICLQKNIYIYIIYIIHPYVYINPAQPFLHNFHFPTEPGVLYPLLPWQPGSKEPGVDCELACRSSKWTQIFLEICIQILCKVILGDLQTCDMIDVYQIGSIMSYNQSMMVYH